MNRSFVQVTYNHFTHRWETRRSGSRLPEWTHPSRDQAMILAVHLLRECRRGRIVVLDEAGKPETLLEVQSRAICESSARRFGSRAAWDQQPSRKSEPASSRLRSWSPS